MNTLSFFWVTTRTSGNPSQVRDQCFLLQVHRCVQSDFQRRSRGSRLSNGEATRRKVVLVDMSSAERGRSAEWKRGVLLLSFWKVAFLGPNRRPSSEGSGLAVKSLGRQHNTLWRSLAGGAGDSGGQKLLSKLPSDCQRGILALMGGPVTHTIKIGGFVVKDDASSLIKFFRISENSHL